MQADTPLLEVSRSPRRKRLILAGAAVLLIGAVAAGGYVMASRKSPAAGDGKGKEAAPALQFNSGEVAWPLREAMPQRIEFSGPLVAPRTAIVRAKAAGTLLDLSVAEGSRVRAGQSLGRIDLADLQARVSERSAMLESAQATLFEAERLHDSNQRLAAQNFISPTALQASNAKLEAARALLKSAQAQLDTTRIGLREAALVAPIDGIVGKRHAVPGEKLAAEQPLLTIVDLATLELAGTVSTHEVGLLKPGQAVVLQVEGMAEPVKGKIDRIAPAAEAGTRAIGVVVALANRDEKLRAGQYATGEVKLADATERLTVPITAVGQASGQDFVWTVENGALVRRVIVTGRKDVAGGRVEVLKGLDAKAPVLAARFDNLKEGAQATIAGSAANPGAPAASASAPRPAS
ncbi:efflux RND transporter periplasmic adaptor subunit [Rivibacter subsaxonicus]|uniref:RND family efflux transporter MFP subunit n=1 Tax=Rivibacter subsaxonicus TaxID=457575 RepID=A0A4Q7VDX2_9BURK|nr:efflux RND transporter periplasmic adaptor subunit [Rivibacter subsaxonicus]RZT93693.1 RND family efflux transporter MFP subunit [Rivibacter subsaxonicus]